MSASEIDWDTYIDNIAQDDSAQDDSGPELSPSPEEFWAEINRLRAENDQVKAENDQVKAENGQIRAAAATVSQAEVDRCCVAQEAHYRAMFQQREAELLTEFERRYATLQTEYDELKKKFDAAVNTLGYYEGGSFPDITDHLVYDCGRGVE
jgi:hypothetical protein